MEWQPIETATKDGTRVDLMNQKSGATDVGFWYQYMDQSMGEDAGGWEQDHGNGDMTHWRSLPDNA